MKADFDGSGGNAEPLRRLLRVQLFNVAQYEDDAVRLGEFVDAGPDLGAGFGLSKL
jgi:hypothetical protein